MNYAGVETVDVLFVGNMLALAIAGCTALSLVIDVLILVKGDLSDLCPARRPCAVW
jgi:hypothetical protein